MAIFQPQSPLLNLPDELLSLVITHVPLDVFLACQLTCKRLNDLCSESGLWRRLCLTEYRYWGPGPSVYELSAAPPASINWKKLLAERKKIDQEVSKNLDAVISSQSHRIANIDKILEHGYNAKDALIRHLDVAEGAEDVLARQYWSAEALGCLERSAAIEEWSKMERGEDVPLERALGAFDLIIAQRPPETLDQLSKHLDDLAEQFKASIPEYDEVPTRENAQMLASFLMTKGITAGNLTTDAHAEHAFRRLQNTLITITLCDESHPSIPIISVAIFCCVARRLGLNAHPCAYPVRVLAVVLPGPPGPPTDAHPLGERIYLDVYGNVAELPHSGLRQQLFTWGVIPGQHDEFLRPASTRQIVERNARNIQQSLTVNHSHEVVLENASRDALRLLSPNRSPSDISSDSLRTVLYPHRAKYAIGWYNVFSPPHRAHGNILLVTLRHLAAMTRDDFKMDIPQFQRLAVPLFGDNQDPEQLDSTLAALQQVRDEDGEPPTVQRRDGVADANGKVKHRIGQVFMHRRYGYTGVITGWDTQCRASTTWMRSMQVDALPGGRGQCFYNVLVDDDSLRYVAEENIETDAYVFDARSGDGNGFSGRDEPAPEGLLRHAGRYFKRWDGRRKRFISNVRDEYPDD